MRRIMKTFIAAGLAATSLTSAPTTFAAAPADPTTPPAPMGGTTQSPMGNGMGMGMGGMNNMMPMMQMMMQMNQMMATCNQVMQSMLDHHPGTKRAPQND